MRLALLLAFGAACSHGHATPVHNAAPANPLGGTRWPALYADDWHFDSVTFDNLAGAPIAIVKASSPGTKSNATDIYLSDHGRPVLAARIDSYRMHGWVLDLRVDGDHIVTRRSEHTDADPECCPSQVRIETWRLHGAQLVAESSQLVARDD